MFRNSIPALLVLAVVTSSCSKDPEVAKREFLQSGDAFVAAGKYEEAIIEYRNAVQQDGMYGEARAKLADAYRRTGDFANAYQQAVRAADILSTDADIQVKAGEMLLAVGQFNEAQSRANRALEINPKDVEALILRASALAGLKRFEDAVGEVEEAIRNDPSRISSYASLGLLQLVTGDRVEAEASFRKAVDTEPSSVNARLALGHFYWAVGRRSDAEAQLKTALELDAKNVLANRMMAILHLGTGRKAEAENFLKAMAENDQSISGKLTLADYYVAARRLDDARAILDQVAKSGDEGFAKATLRLAGIGAVSGNASVSQRLVDEVLAKEPGNVEALMVKTLMLMGGGRLDEALVSAQGAVRGAPKSGAAQFMLGQVLMRRDEVPAAAGAFREALKLSPGMARAELELANIHLTDGRLDDAEHFARSAVSKISGAVDAHLLLTKVQIAKGNIAAAEPTLRAMAKALPRNPRIQATVGELELAKKNLPGARAAFSKALAEDPRDFDSLKGILALEIQGKRGDAARSRLKAALSSEPEDARLLLLAGRVHNVLGDAADAESMWRKAIEVGPDEVGSYFELARFYRQHQRLPEAIQRLEEFTKANPKSVAGQTFLGMLLQAQNNIREAQRRYEIALELEPSSPLAANNLAAIYTQSGSNLERALQLAQIAKSKMPDRPEVNDTLGWAYYRKGLFSDASASFSESVRLDPDNAKYHYRLGLAQLGASDRIRARASFSKALSLSPTFDGADDARKALAGLN